MSENTNSPISISSFPRPILHIDCDAFFTSVEQALHPELKGKPVVTGNERGIVACASYEAKALGVKRPMRLWEAQKALPNLICLPSDYETYSIYSKRMFSIIREFTPEVEEYSIDECFAELSGLRRVYRTGYQEIALKIKTAVQEQLGLTVSVGLSASKTLAKIASKENKPNGFTVVRASELHRYLPKVALDRVCGFGPNTVALLNKRGVYNCWDYVSKSKIWAKQLLGKIGMELWDELRGEPVYPLVIEEKTNYDSISKTKTFTPPSYDKDFVRAQLVRNTESALIKLRRHKLRAKAICIFLRDQEFRSWGTEAELDRSTSSILDVVPIVNQLFDKVFKEKVLCRLTGIVLSKIEPDRTEQYSLFDDVPKIQAHRSIDRVIDEVNGLYGKHKLHLGTSLWLGRHKQHVSERGDLPQRKTEQLKGETFRQHLGVPIWSIKV
jgi:DNA polymerase IV